MEPKEFVKPPLQHETDYDTGKAERQAFFQWLQSQKDFQMEIKKKQLPSFSRTKARERDLQAALHEQILADPDGKKILGGG